METVTFGSGVAALTTTPLGYGCMGLTAFYNNATPEAEAIAVLKTAFDLGVRHFDTAQLYIRQLEDGTVLRNEVLVGKFLKTLSPKERATVTVATKFFPVNMATGKFEFNEQNFITATKQSAENLGVDSIDLYYFHRTYPEDVVPVQVWMTSAKKLVQQGLVKRIGLSEASADIIRKANAIHPITCVQQEWSLFARDLEETIVPTCQELNIGIIAYSPIGRGFLAGAFSKDFKPKDWRKTIPYLSDENFENNLKIINEIRNIAEEKNCSVGAICLKWLINKGALPIPGTTKISHLKENMKSLEIELKGNDMKKLEELANNFVGERGDESYMKSTFNRGKKLNNL